MAWAKLGRGYKHRMLMLRTMTTQLIKYGRIETTLPKAKALKKVADNIIQLGKRGNNPAKTKINGFLTEKEAYYKLMTDLVPHYINRHGGYTRVIRSRIRNSVQKEKIGSELGTKSLRYVEHDAAEMAFIEFVDWKGELRPARKPNPQYNGERRLWNRKKKSKDTPLKINK